LPWLVAKLFHTIWQPKGSWSQIIMLWYLGKKYQHLALLDYPLHPLDHTTSLSRKYPLSIKNSQFFLNAC
jgi:hypothetical protein